MKKKKPSKTQLLQAEIDRLNTNLTIAVQERDENITIYKKALEAKEKQLAEANKRLSDATMALTHAWENLTGKRIILPAEGLRSGVGSGLSRL